MGETIAIALLWLFVVNLGVVVGAGWYELRVVAPMWASAPPRSLTSPESGLSFWAWVTTGPLTLLTVANLVAASLTRGPARPWWLAAGIIIAAERIATFGYFVPTMIGLQRNQAARPAEAAAKFARWRALNLARNIASTVAWLLALKALVMVGG